MILQVQLAPDISLQEVMPLILRSNFFSVSERSLSSTSKSLFLKRLNQSLCVVSDRVW